MENQEQQTQSIIQPQIPAQPAAETVVEPTKKTLPKWPLIIVGVILLAVLLIGTYMLGKSQGVSQKPVSETLTSITPNPTITQSAPTTTLTSDETATWKTFSNNYLSFKYPSDWKIADPYPDTPDQSTYIGIIPADQTVSGTVTPILITRFDNPNNLSLQQWDAVRSANSAMASSLYSASAQVTTIAGDTTYINTDANCEPYNCYQEIVMAKDNIFQFQNIKLNPVGSNPTTVGQDYQSNQLILNNILSTLKFN